MCDQPCDSRTLVRGRAFIWCRDENGSIEIRPALGAPVRATFSAEQYAAALDLIASSPDGTPLGARADEEVPVGSLGRLMSTFGKSRPHASWLAAIAVDEGFAEADYRGNRAGGLWLLAASDGRDPTIDGEQDDAPERWTRLDGKTHGPRPDATRTADRLRALADRIERAEPVDGTAWEFDLADASGTGAEEVLRRIAEWEREMSGAKYLYRFRVADPALASRCRDALAGAKSRNVGGRRFARLNDAPATSACLYVGSSRSLASRMRQHLGLGHRGTYALQVCHWRGLAPLDGVLHLDVSRFAPDTGADVLQALEDSLWLAERPRFGKMGAR